MWYRYANIIWSSYQLWPHNDTDLWYTSFFMLLHFKKKLNKYVMYKCKTSISKRWKSDSMTRHRVLKSRQCSSWSAGTSVTAGTSVSELYVCSIIRPYFADILTMAVKSAKWSLALFVPDMVNLKKLPINLWIFHSPSTIPCQLYFVTLLTV